MKPVVVHEDARAELDEAIRWYEQRRKGLGLEFHSEVQRAVSRLWPEPSDGLCLQSFRISLSTRPALSVRNLLSRVVGCRMDRRDCPRKAEA